MGDVDFFLPVMISEACIKSMLAVFRLPRKVGDESQPCSWLHMHILLKKAPGPQRDCIPFSQGAKLGWLDKEHVGRGTVSFPSSRLLVM